MPIISELNSLKMQILDFLGAVFLIDFVHFEDAGSG